MDERQLRVLRELGELGSVRAVADALDITPSAVSQQLRLLQRSIPVSLTERRGRTLGLTDAGRELAAAGAEVQAALSRARDIASGLASEPAGKVTISAFISAALAYFPDLVDRFPAGGSIEVAVADEDVAQSDFPRLTAAYDVVIAHRLEHTPPWPATVRIVPLLREPLDVALPVGHPLSDHRRLSAAAVAGEPWIATHAGFPVGATIDAIAAVAGRPVAIRHRVNEFTVAVELVRNGAGLALVPRWTTPRPDGVVLRPLAGISSSRRIDALIRPDHASRRAVTEVVAQLRATSERLSRG